MKLNKYCILNRNDLRSPAFPSGEAARERVLGELKEYQLDIRNREALPQIVAPTWLVIASEHKNSVFPPTTFPPAGGPPTPDQEGPHHIKWSLAGESLAFDDPDHWTSFTFDSNPHDDFLRDCFPELFTTSGEHSAGSQSFDLFQVASEHTQLLSSTIDPQCLQGIGPPAWSITPSAPQIALPFLQNDHDRRSTESSTWIQRAAPSSNITTSLLCNVQDYDTQMHGFLDMQPWCEYPATVTSFNTVAPILEQRNFPDTDNSFLVSSRIEYGIDAQLRAAPEDLETGMLLPEGRDDRVQSCYRCRWSTCEKAFETTDSLHNHVKEHVKAMKASARCLWLGCAKGSLTAALLNKHIRLHTRPFACKYPLCGHCSATTRDSRRHAKTHGLHAGDLIYHCPIKGCGYNQGGSQNPFRRLDHARRHIYRQHNQTIDPIPDMI
ncbi:hypothetical protein V8E51_009700 [Hyaloscypha variabilis]